MTKVNDAAQLRAQLAVLSIFRDLGVPAGDALSVDQLVELWPDYGIRANDLVSALDGLVREGYLAHMPGTADQIVLTIAGDRWFRQQPALLEYRLLVPRASRARYQRIQGQQPETPVDRRRGGDRRARFGTG